MSDQTERPDDIVSTACDHLVGNLYFNLDAISLISGKLHPDEMPEGDAKMLYTEMCRLHISPDKTLSAGSLEASLKTVGFNDDYLIGLQSRIGIDSLETLDDYRKVINNWAEVQVIRHQAMRVIAESNNPGARSDELYPMMMQVPQTSTANGFKDISEYSTEIMQDIDDWEQGIRSDGLSTGFEALDRFFYLEQSKLYLIAARPSMGKTSLAMDIGRNVANQLQRTNEPGCVAVFSAEMSGKQLTIRMGAATARVNTQRLKSQQAEPKEYQALREAIHSNNELNIKIDDSSSPSPEQMYYKLAMIDAIVPVKLVIFDFIELGNPDDKGKNQTRNEEQRVSAIAVGLKNIAKQMNVPVIGLSQLSREVEKRADKLPVLADLRYSGMLEQIADVVAFIMRPEYYLKRNMTCYLDERHGMVEEGSSHPHGQNVAYIGVAKNREGATGMDAMHFTERYTLFANLEHERKELNDY
jgi:replicative DNA helicase